MLQKCHNSGNLSETRKRRRQKIVLLKNITHSMEIARPLRETDNRMKWRRQFTVLPKFKVRMEDGKARQGNPRSISFFLLSYSSRLDVVVESCMGTAICFHPPTVLTYLSPSPPHHRNTCPCLHPVPATSVPIPIPVTITHQPLVLLSRLW